MLTTPVENEIYVTAFELGTISGACMLWKIDPPSNLSKQWEPQFRFVGPQRGFA